ncbi:MAG: hypothetical protein JWO03_1763, partial [Bacteroidetes bacterium]|nr:hypothetical protein [Bacteroidota bacterium]
SRTYFEPMYMQTAVRFCRDGVGVESEAHLTQPWINCFYDREDALKGRQILEEAVAASGKFPEDQKLMDAYLMW